MDTQDKNRVLTFSLSDSDIEKLNKLNIDGNRSAYIRSLINQAWAEHEGRAMSNPIEPKVIEHSA